MEFLEQWNPQSPWHDRRVRLAANLAIDRKGINEAERLGYSRLTGSMIPSIMDFALRIEPYPYDPARAKRLLAEAGYPGGFDAGDLTPLPPFTTMGEAVANDLAGVGIRTRVRTMERVTFLEAWRNKKLQGLIVNATAAQGNAAPVSRPSSSPARRTPTAAIRTSTICSCSRRRSATARSARRSCIRFSG